MLVVSPSFDYYRVHPTDSGKAHALGTSFTLQAKIWRYGISQQGLPVIMRKTLLATILLLASQQTLASNDYNTPATASNFSYDYAEARIGASPFTFGAGFSSSIHPNAHMLARVDSELDGDFDAAAGFGFHSPINNWADLTGAMLLRVAKPSSSSDTDAGMELNLGVRQWLGPQLEVGGKGGYVSLDNDDNWIASVYARFHSTELFSIGAEARINDFYDNQLMFTTRFKF